MKTLGFEGNKYEIPSAWNDISTEQDLLELCRILLLPLDTKYKRFLIIGHFTGITFKQMNKISPTAITEILSVVDFVFLPSRLTINLLPELYGMKGPENGLTNFTFEQFFGFTEPYMYKISQGSTNDLDNLIGIMYNYNNNTDNTIIISRLTPSQKLAIYLFYQGCSNFIKNKFKHVFENSSGTAPDGLEFIRLVNKLNQGDISKNEKIKQTNIYEALSFLNSLSDKK